ncbi:MAG: uroporphyrinogen-III synthase [Nitriliruptoraceae bacterium]
MSAAPGATEVPLAGTRVLVGRAAGQADELLDRIRRLGGVPVHAPLLEFGPGDQAALTHAVEDLEAEAFVAVCLTSPNGVHALVDSIGSRERAARLLGTVRIACVGPGTARALEERTGLTPWLVPERATTESLARAFPEGSGRVLLPRADLANPVLSEVLVQRGHDPVDVIAYRTSCPDRLPDGVLDALAAGEIDLLAFASSSTVRNFVRLVGDQPWRGRVVSIGPVTTATCRRLGIDVAEEADPHDLDGLVAALVRAVARARDNYPRAQ